jgi:hypothetical protein
MKMMMVKVGRMMTMMNKETFLSYISVILTVGLVYTFGELKYEKKIAKAKELWLLEDTQELEKEIEKLNEVVKVLAKQNREYEAILSVIKLKMEEAKQGKPIEVPKQEPKPQTQKKQPSLFERGYPGRYIPKGEIPPNSNIFKI